MSAPFFANVRYKFMIQKKTVAMISALLIFLSLTVFWPVVHFQFVDYDDGINVSKNPLLNPPSLSNILQFWKEPYQHLYIPFTYTIWSITAWISQSAHPAADKLNPSVFHTANLIFHILNALIVFSIIRLLLRHISNVQVKHPEKDTERSNYAAGIGAVLFSIHPIQVEPVAWVTGLKDILFGHLSLIAIWQYLIYASRSKTPCELKQIAKNTHILEDRKGNRRLKKEKESVQHSAKVKVQQRDSLLYFYYAIAVFTYILALLSKPTAVIIPLMLLILDRFIVGRPVKGSISSLIVWFAIGVPFFAVNKLAQPDVAVAFVTPLWSRFLIAGDTIVFYIYKFFLPITVGSYAYCRTPEVVLQQIWSYFAWIVPLGIAGLIRFQKERTVLFASFGIFIAGILPVLGFIPFLAQNFSTVSDRYLYLSMLGPALALAWFIATRWNAKILMVCILLLCALAILSAFQVQYWRNSITLFDHALKLNPDNFVAHYNLGGALRDIGKIDEAILHFSESRRLKPDYADTNNNLANLLLSKGQFDDSIFLYHEALKLKPDDADFNYNLALALEKQGKPDKALEHYYAALKINPESPIYHNSLGNALLDLKRYDKAIAHYTEAIKVNHNYADAHYNIGNALVGQEKYSDAIPHYMEAIKIKPDYVEAHNNLGAAYGKLERWDEAIKKWNDTLFLNQNHEVARQNRDAVMKMLRR